MTARGFLERRYRNVLLLIWNGMLPFLGATIACEVFGLPAWVMAVGFVGFGVAWLTMMVAYFSAFPCPRCRTSLFPLVMGRSAFWVRFDDRIQCYPFCRLEMDAELPLAPARSN